MTSEGGVVWAEVLRAMTLREVAAASGTVTAMAPAMTLFAAVTRFDRPDAWWVPGCLLVMALAGLLCIAIALVGYGDSHHDWARQHLQVAGTR